MIKRIVRSIVQSLINTFLCGTHYFGFKRFLLNLIGVEIGLNTKVVGPFEVGNVSKIKIGNDCWIGKDFKVHGNGTFIVGDNCDIGPEVSVLTGGHKIGDGNRRAGEGELYSVNIGNGCWIGARSTLYGNIKLNNSCIVGACSFVNKNVDSNCVVVGIPAKVISCLDRKEEQK